MQSIGRFQGLAQVARIENVTASEPRGKDNTLVKETQDAYKDKASSQGLDAALDHTNRHLAAHNKRIDRSVHEGTKAVIYTVTDTKTNEVISEYPSRRVQDMIANLMQLNGVAFDKRI